MKKNIISTAYAPLQPPYQIIKYQDDLAMQMGTLIVTTEKEVMNGETGYGIETHSHPVVAYCSKFVPEYQNMQQAGHAFMEGTVWNNVELKDVTTVCLNGARLNWQSFMDFLLNDSLATAYTHVACVNIYWRLYKFGVTVEPPHEDHCVIRLREAQQPECTGYSLQSGGEDLMFINVPLTTLDDDCNTIARSQEAVWTDLSMQLDTYRRVLQMVKRTAQFSVSYVTDDEKFSDLVERLNNTEKFTHMSGFPL